MRGSWFVIRGADCGVRSAGCGVRSAEYGCEAKPVPQARNAPGTRPGTHLFTTRMIRSAFAVLVLCATSAFAQFEEQVSVSYVMVPFTVLSGNGAPITDLKAK